ncbi:MAG: trimethylamine methyltransferase family protein, partial [Pseudomonadota bacterium]
ISAMERDYFYPKIADREPPVTWTEKGELDAWSRARDVAKSILETHHPEYLPVNVEARIRDEFNILLST